MSNFRIGLYESKVIVPIQSFAPGTYTFQFGMPAGNSILSTIFVQTISGTVKVNYHDSGPGDGTQAGERVDLDGHPLISSGAPISDRRIIARLANKPKVEIIVTGGSVTIGVHVAVVSDFPQEPKVYDGKPVDIEGDRGVPLMLLDEDTNEWKAARGKDGVAFVSSGVTGTTEVIREVATTTWVAYPTTGNIDRFEVECDRDNPNARRLWVSTDTIKYTVLGPGDSIEQTLSPAGKIYLRSAASTLNFSAWLNKV